jgi:AraC-like DNA-binding protein
LKECDTRVSVAPAVQYVEYAPSFPIAGVIRCIWTLEGRLVDLAAAAQPILPDGRAEIVVHLGDPFDIVGEDGRTQRQPRTIFAGQLMSPLVLRPTGAIAVVGVRFRADGVRAVIDAPQHRLAGQTLDLRDVSGTLARQLHDACAGQSTLAHAARAVETCLERHLDESRIDRHVRVAVSAIRRQSGIGSVEAAAALTGISRRHLERRFQDVVGLSPKRFARITRFQHALRIFEQGASGRRGAVTAAACGYADQAHFIREFGELAGCSPKAHLLRDALLNSLFAETASW